MIMAWLEPKFLLVTCDWPCGVYGPTQIPQRRIVSSNEHSPLNIAPDTDDVIFCVIPNSSKSLCGGIWNKIYLISLVEELVLFKLIFPQLPPYWRMLILRRQNKHFRHLRSPYVVVKWIVVNRADIWTREVVINSSKQTSECHYLIWEHQEEKKESK